MAFTAMLENLRSAKEIAVDLEYHSYRTFAGFVCLMQISTRDGDWVVDALALRDVLEELNEVFTDPNIVKVRLGFAPPLHFGELSILIVIRFSTALKAILYGSSKISTSTL